VLIVCCETARLPFDHADWLIMILRPPLCQRERAREAGSLLETHSQRAHAATARRERERRCIVSGDEGLMAHSEPLSMAC
jgi:hypothetical protein